MSGKLTIKRVSRIWARDVVSYFKTNPEAWEKLNSGEEIEIPEEILPELRGVEIIKKKKEVKIIKDKEEEDGN